ncbi:MAG: T9SS type A sorting domain-containing protein [Patescibacteria group bacterium]
MKSILYLLLIILSSSLKAQLPIEVDHSPEMPSPLNQGNSGACVAFSACYLKTWQESKEIGWNVKDSAHIFSPAFIYNLAHTHGQAPGLGGGYALNVIIENGGVSLRDFPFDPNNDSTQANDELRHKALYYRDQSWYLIKSDSLRLAKETLVKMPIITEISFNGYSHSVCLVGYNDTIRIGGYLGAFKYINSYGPGWKGNNINQWGSNGYGWLPYNYAHDDFYVLENRINSNPDVVFKFKNNCSGVNVNNMNASTKLYFLKGSDTIKILERKISRSYSYDAEKYFLVTLDNFRDTLDNCDTILLKSFVSDWDRGVIEAPLAINNCYYYDKNSEAFISLSFKSEVSNLSLEIDSVEVGGAILPQKQWQYLTSHYLSAKIASPKLANGFKKITNLYEIKCSPNPFSENTNFEIKLDKTAIVDLKIYDASGRLINSVITKEKMMTGEHNINYSGNLPSGLYFAQVKINNYIKVIKILRF